MTDKKIIQPEVLAPAGGMEQLVAAVRSGADAVYLGTKSFNARRQAKNFDADELREAVRFCHARGVKVHVALNTLVFDDEMEQLCEELRMLAHCGVDALIVQDLAVASLARALVPEMALHASTQMTIHNAIGAREAQKLGFSRVVLARELTLEEIREIRKETDIELEVFVHGALCMSVSGTCYLSAMLGTRSGNRGQCAQPCRLNFKAGEREYALSLKDLSATQHLAALRDCGVDSFKIEGRMKRPEYVAAAVDACRRALGGEAVDVATLQAVFSRGGFTDGYLTGVRDLQMFGFRSREDAEASARSLSSVTGLYRRERQSVPVEMLLAMSADEGAALTVDDKEKCFTVFGDVVTPDGAALDADTALRALSQTGGTPFFVKEFALHNPDGLYVLPGELKRMRREALERLLELRSAVKSYDFTENTVIAVPERAREKGKQPEVQLRYRRFSQVFDPSAGARVSLPVFEIEAHPEAIALFGGRLSAELPELLFGRDVADARAVLLSLRERGLESVTAHNLAAVALGRECELEVFGGYGLNVTNARSGEVYTEMGVKDIALSIELSAGRVAAMGGSYVRGVLGYGYLPLMKLRNCPVKTRAGCEGCAGERELIDRKGIAFPVICERKRFSVMLNSVPLYIGNRPVRGVDYYLLYYTNEDSAVCSDVYTRFLRGEPPEGRATTGLYYRTVE